MQKIRLVSGKKFSVQTINAHNADTLEILFVDETFVNLCESFDPSNVKFEKDDLLILKIMEDDELISIQNMFTQVLSLDKIKLSVTLKREYALEAEIGILKQQIIELQEKQTAIESQALQTFQVLKEKG